MTWVLWRQHRGQALWTVLTVGVLGALMLWVGLHAAHTLHPFRVNGCVGPDPTVVRAKPGTSCAGFEGFAQKYGYTIPAFELGVPLVLVIVGALVGAPLVAREIEQRTQLVAWTQSVTRRRWYSWKVLTVGAALTAVGLAVGLANYRLSQPLTAGGVTTSRWPWFHSAGLAPAGEVLVAFALAVALGAWTRRTLPAAGGALVGFLVLLLITGNAVKHLTPVSHTTRGVPASGWDIGGGGGDLVPYHPASQWWPLQLTYLALMVVIAAALLAVGWRATRTRAV